MTAFVLVLVSKNPKGDVTYQPSGCDEGATLGNAVPKPPTLKVVAHPPTSDLRAPRFAKRRTTLGHQTRGGLGQPINHQLSTFNTVINHQQSTLNHGLTPQWGTRNARNLLQRQ